MDFWTQLARYSFYETERLTLRPPSFSDAEAFYDIASDKDNLHFVFPSVISQEESDYLLTHAFLENPLGIWVICKKGSDKMIGIIRFEKIHLHLLSAEIGYLLHADFRAYGYMTEALRNVTFLAFQEFGLKELRIVTHLENLASQQVALNTGFKIHKRYKGSDRYTRKTKNYIQYQLSKGDYHE